MPHAHRQALRVRQLVRLVRRWEIGEWLWAYLVVSVGLAVGACIVLLLDY